MDWDRLAGESSKAFAALVTYRDLGNERSYAIVGRMLGKSKTLIERWGRTHRWAERVKAYDEHMDDIRITTNFRERALMLERQIRDAFDLQDKAMQALKKLDADRLSAFQIARLFEVGARIERECRGHEGAPQIPKIEVIIGED